MAESPEITEILRRTVQANATLYKGWVDLSLDYWRRVGEIFGVATPSGLGATGFQSAEPFEDEAAGTGVLELEGDVGTSARGAFLVTNDLGRKLKCDFVSSGLSGPRGATAKAQVRFEPASVELAPGEQAVVHAVVPVDDQLTPGAAYSGTVSIRGMEGFSVPFVLRRTHSIEEAERAASRQDGEPDAGHAGSSGAQPSADVKAKAGPSIAKPAAKSAAKSARPPKAATGKPTKKAGTKKAAARKRRSRQKD